MEKNANPASRRPKKPAAAAASLQSQSKFLFVNKNAGSKYLSRSFAPGEELQIRRHVKQNTDGRGQTRRGGGVGVGASTSSKHNRAKPQAAAQDLTTSTASTPKSSSESHGRAIKLALDDAPDFDDHDQEHGILTKRSETPPHQRHGTQKREIQPHADPARLVDPYSAAPVQLDKLAQKVLRFYLSNTHNDRSESFKSSLAPATRRLQTLMHWWLVDAFTNKLKLSCAVASASVNLHLFHKLVPRSQALWYTQRAVHTMRVELAAAEHATPEQFFCMILLFNVESYLGNGEGAIVHVRAMWHTWSQIGGFDKLVASTSALFVSMIFFQHSIRWWDADPPISPFWKPSVEDLPWPPRLMHKQDKNVQPRRSLSTAVDSRILSRADVRRFIRPILSYARDRVEVSDEDIGTFSWEFRNFKLRQRICCMQSNDLRIHVLRRTLHVLVSTLSGYAWLTVYLAESCRAMKADLVRMADHEWKGERHLRTFCLAVGTIHSLDSWFVRELATIYSDWQPHAILQDLHCACGPFVQPNLVPTEALEGLAKDIAECSDEQDQRPDPNQTDQTVPDVPPYGVGRRYWETTCKLPKAWLDG